jgi:hypothetical protein
MPRDIPIIFSPPMVQAELDDLKTMSRRLAWRDPVGIYQEKDAAKCRRLGWKVSGPDDTGYRIGWPPSPWQKVKVGDRLWVREEWRVSATFDAKKPADLPARSMSVMFKAGGSIANQGAGHWAPDRTWPPAGTFPAWAGRRRASMHMPRWASRLTLIVTATKIERLQSISDDDCFAEGLVPFGERDPDGRIFKNPIRPNEGGLGVWAFGELWKHLHGEESWNANPEVVALSFTVIKTNIDAPEARAA